MSHWNFCGFCHSRFRIEELIKSAIIAPQKHQLILFYNSVYEETWNHLTKDLSKVQFSWFYTDIKIVFFFFFLNDFNYNQLWEGGKKTSQSLWVGSYCFFKHFYSPACKMKNVFYPLVIILIRVLSSGESKFEIFFLLSLLLPFRKRHSQLIDYSTFLLCQKWQS